MWIARHHFTKLKKACLTIQQKHRAQQKMKAKIKEYQDLKNATIIIQAFVRGHASRKCYNNMRASAIKIQSFARMMIARKNFCITRKAIICIQRRYRAKCLMTSQRLDYLNKRNAIILFQSKIRALIARKKFLRKKNACIIIQSAYRMWKQRTSYLKLHTATINIQNRFRALQIGRKTRSNFLRNRNACIKIQSYMRMIKQKREYRKKRLSAIIIQTRFRALCYAKKERQSYLKFRDCCIFIQSLIRMKLAKNKFLKTCRACVVIQSYFRMFAARKEFLKMKKSVAVIHKYFIAWSQGRKERTKYLKMKKSAVKLQSNLRGFIVRKNLKKDKLACIKIQAQFRSYICYKKYKSQKYAAVVLQKHIRAFLIGRQTRKSYLKSKELIIKSQAVVRGWLVRKHNKQLSASATKIQASYRAFVCRKEYLERRYSIITLQKYFRAYLIGSKARKHYVLKKHSAIVIQSAWRGLKTRRELLKQKQAATIIQSYVRKMLLRKKFLKLKQCVRVIQQYYLTYKIAREEFLLYQEKRKCCIKIQSCWRKYLLNKQRKKEIDAAIVIQKRFRKWRQYQAELELNHSYKWTFYQQRQWYLQLRTNIVQFQRMARIYIAERKQAAIVIQSFFRMFLAQKIFRREKSALRIQALWRGYAVRCKVTNKCIISARQKIKNTVAREYDTLLNRTKRGLEILLNKNNLNQMLQALRDLDTCTRLLPTCCVRLAESGGLSVLIELIWSCNRSEPHKEIIIYCLNIILNVAKYNKTVNSVWEQFRVDIFLPLMKVYREKSTVIFNKCCSLFYIFCQDPDKAELLRSSEEFTTQVESLHNMVMRKHTIADRRSKQFFNTSTQPMKSGKSFVDLRGSLQIDPEWLLGKHRKREFKDPVLAISSLVESLNLREKPIRTKK